MLTPATNEKLAAGYRSLLVAQEDGTAPPPGHVSLADYARHSGVSEETVRRIEQSGIARLRAGCALLGITPEQLRGYLARTQTTFPAGRTDTADMKTGTDQAPAHRAPTPAPHGDT